MVQDGEVMYCPKCGQKNAENTFRCTGCGFQLHGSEQSQVATEGGGLGRLIPYKNAQALWAYYLGIFSLIPCLGIPLGLAALVLGVGGLKHAGRNPETRGKGHAWTGIILGSLCVVGNAVALVYFYAGI